ncbi:TetR/AcrR family transcriptional regulator [Nocardia sp. NPDC055002]
MEKTTIAHIAQAADVPVGNVYYYFKTKDRLAQAAISAHARTLREIITALEQIESPADRLKAPIGGWVAQRVMASQFGCPSKPLATELDRRADGLDRELAAVIGELLAWMEASSRRGVAPTPGNWLSRYSPHIRISRCSPILFVIPH